MEHVESFIRNLTNKKTGFPGAMATNVDFKKEYNFDDYLITNKLDGERFLIFGFENNTYRMNRKSKIEQVSFSIPNGTVFDTEYYSEAYHIIDFIAEDFKLKTISFNSRIKQTKTFIKPKELKFKHFLKISKKNLIFLEKELKSIYLQKEFEGYILVLKKNKLVFKTTPDIMKWKIFDLNTVDFLYENGLLKIKTKHGLETKANSIFQNYLQGNLIKNGDIIECKPVLQKQTLNWIPYRFRYDKTEPNFITVYNDTLKTIKNYKDIYTFLKLNK